ncbi:phage tail tip fiber protein [Providencia rettgeri]|uniref:phage tail tip fiber protein n=1 Tax=Providencia rettgeri TaxID=587 RepID=UPI003D2E7C10
MQEQIDFNKDNLTDLKIDSDDFRQKVISIDRELEAVNEAVMEVVHFSTENYYELKEESAKGKASIKRLEQVQADFTASQAKYQQEVAAQFEHTAADVLNVQNALAKSNEAFAEDIRQVRADLGETNDEVGTIKGRVTTVETATADLKQAQAKFEQSTTAQFGEMTGYITNINQTITNLEFSFSEALMQTNAQVNETNSELLKTKSEVTRLATATATNEQATAELAENVKAQREQSEAEFVDVRKSIAEKDKAQSERTEQVRAELGKDINANKEEIDKNKGELSNISAAVTKNTTAIAETDKTLTEVNQQAESRFEDNEAFIAYIQQTMANMEGANVETVGQLTAQHNIQGTEILKARASIRNIETVVANDKIAFAQKIEQLDAQYGDINSRVSSLQKVVADNQKSQVEVNEFIKSEVGDTQAAIEKMAKTEVDYQGNASSVISFKTAVMYNGEYYDAEMIIGAGVKNGKVTTQIGFSADTFAIFNPVSGKLETAFAVVNGQVFIGSGFIQDGSITNAKIGNVIQSNDFKKGEKGWQIDKNGNPEFNDGTFRGKVYANGGEFNGTVYVEKLIGDNATATVYKEATKDEIHGNRYDQVIETSVIYVGGMPYDIDLLMPTMQFESSCSTSTGIKAAYVQVIIDGVTYTPQTTTIVGDDTSFWNLICSLYVTIPATKKDVKVTVRYTTNHENRCTTKIKPAMIIACKHNSSSFKFS